MPGQADEREHHQAQQHAVDRGGEPKGQPTKCGPGAVEWLRQGMRKAPPRVCTRPGGAEVGSSGRLPSLTAAVMKACCGKNNTKPAAATANAGWPGATSSAVSKASKTTRAPITTDASRMAYN